MFPYSKEQTVEMLKAAVMNEVECRNRTYQDNEELSQQLQSFAEWLVNPKGKTMCFLSGPCGNGKSTLLYALQRVFNFVDLSDEYNNRIGLRIVTAKEFFLLAQDDPKKFMDIIRNDMLAIDDLGIEPTEQKVYGNISYPLVDMFYERYDRRLPTIFTTNLTPKDIALKYGARVADRLSEVACNIVFKNDSFRTQ